MRRTRANWLAIGAVLWAANWATPAQAAPPTAAQIDAARINGLAWLMSNQERDGSWKLAGQTSVQSTSAAIDALAHAGIVRGFPYMSGLSNLQNAQAASIDALARQAATLHAAGTAIAPLMARLGQSQNGNASWGAYAGYGSSLPDTPLALSAQLRAGTANVASVTTTLCRGVLDALKPDHSFTYLPGSAANGALLPTAYAAIALHSTRTTLGYNTLSCPTSHVLTTRVTNAANWLLARQSATDGGFSDDGNSAVLETAVAVLALRHVHPTTYAAPVGEALRFLVARQAPDGSWGADPFATALALQALPKLSVGTLADSNLNGLPDAVESRLGADPTAPNRAPADGNGRSVAGATVSQLVATGRQNQAFGFDLPGQAGATTPAWRIVGGYLPDGVALDASTGRLSGTPVAAGVFNFSYAVSAPGNPERQVAAQILIEVAMAPEDADVPLPGWALGLLAALLLARGGLLTGRRRTKQ
jgi:alpha-D-ribose 1-methylphosphonate 5-triphosphate synthase subunit PhnG